MTHRVTLERGRPAQRAVLANLVQLYIHDFNDLLAPERKAALGEDGRFAEDLYLDRYWSEAERSVWFVRVDGVLAGFALLNRHAHSGLPVDFNLGEFFVTRAWRRARIGTQAATMLIAMHPGQWEIAVGAHNPSAQRFWSSVIAGLAPSSVETLPGDGKEWTGPILRFVRR